MKLKKCMLIANDCYKKGTKITNNKPYGIVVHSTGANNPSIRRYVQPLKSDSSYSEITADIGINAGGNHWNQPGVAKCVHAFIGKNAKGEVETYQTLPFNVCCWGSGRGAKGSYNYNPTACLQFEICEDALSDRTYFEKAFKEAAEFCVYLCSQYGISTDKIYSHAECHKAGYGSNHADCDHWLKKFGRTMNDFRSEVKELLKKTSQSPADQGKPANTAESVTPAVKPAAKPSQTTTPAKPVFEPYMVRITASSLNVRKGPGTNYGVNMQISSREVYTIVEESSGKGASKWGKLKSGAGWISLDFTLRK